MSSVRCSQRLRNKENLEVVRAEAKQVSPPQCVTRPQAATSAKASEALPEPLPVPPAAGKIPLVEIGVSDRVSAELHLQNSASEPAEKLSTTVILSSGDVSPKESRVDELPPAARELVFPQTPEADGAAESEAASELKTGKAANTTVILSDEPWLEEVDGSAQVQEGSAKQPSQRVRDSPETPTGSRLSRRSVRRSLMGKASMTRRTSLAEKYSLASKRESMIRKSITRTMVKRKAARKSSVSSACVDGKSERRQMSLICTFSALFVDLLLKEGNVTGLDLQCGCSSGSS